MKLNFRDLKQQKFSIEAESSDTIAQVKEKVASEKGWDVAQQKLIYSGKILVDTNTVESYNIEEKGFIVCMVSKPKAVAAPKTAAPPSTPAASTSTPAPPAAPQQNPASTDLPNPPATPSPSGADAAATPVAGAPPADAAFNDPSALIVGQQRSGVIIQMEAMGFERAEIDRAMRAAYFNPDRAIDYLLNGIPEGVQTEQRQTAATGSNPQGGGDGGGAAAAAGNPSPGGETQATNQAATGGIATTAAPGDEPVNLFEAAAQAGGRGGTGASGAARSGATGAAAGITGPAGSPASLDFLRNSPQFQQLRQLVQQEPAMLEPVLQQVAEGNPQLAQMIQQNQDQFLQLLNEGNNAGGEGIGGMGETGPMPPGAVPVSVTEEERDAIERLCRLGFPRDQAVQAYFACDKNEEWAASFLFEQPEDEDS